MNGLPKWFLQVLTCVLLIAALGLFLEGLARFRSAPTDQWVWEPGAGAFNPRTGVLCAFEGEKLICRKWIRNDAFADLGE